MVCHFIFVIFTHIYPYFVRSICLFWKTACLIGQYCYKDNVLYDFRTHFASSFSQSNTKFKNYLYKIFEIVLYDKKELIEKISIRIIY